MNENSFGENLKEIRKRQNLTQQQLADKLEVSLMTIRRLETGARQPKIFMIEKIAKALEVSPSYLIGYDEKIVNPNNYTDKELTELKNTAWDLYKQHIKEKNSPEYMVNQALSKLNKLGKRKAVERVEELTEILKYTAPDQNDKDEE